MEERSPHAVHSTVSHTGFTAEPAASSSDVVNCSTFSAAATASDGRTDAGSAIVTVALLVATSSSTGASGIKCSTCLLLERFFGVRPCFIVSASTLASSCMWWTQNSEPSATVRSQGWPSRSRAAQRRNEAMWELWLLAWALAPRACVRARAKNPPPLPSAIAPEAGPNRSTSFAGEGCLSRQELPARLESSLAEGYGRRDVVVPDSRGTFMGIGRLVSGRFNLVL